MRWSNSNYIQVQVQFIIYAHPVSYKYYIQYLTIMRYHAIPDIRQKWGGLYHRALLYDLYRISDLTNFFFLSYPYNNSVTWTNGINIIYNWYSNSVFPVCRVYSNYTSIPTINLYHRVHVTVWPIQCLCTWPYLRGEGVPEIQIPSPDLLSIFYKFLR